MVIKLKPILLVIGAIAVTATSFGATYYYISSKEDAVELKRLVGVECRRFYERERLPGYLHVEAADAWEKDGAIIVELEAKEQADSHSYMRRLCVVDKTKSSITIPAVRNEGKWEK